MTKMIPNQASIQNFISNKLLYIKPILRYKKASKIGVLDVATNLCNSYIHSNIKQGDSILYNTKVFKHNTYKNIRLRTFIIAKQISNSYGILSKMNSIIQESENNTETKYLQILKPIKGGYVGYYAGLFGFVSTDDVTKILRSIDLTSQNLPNLLYLSELHNTNNFLKPRTLFKIDKINLQPKIKKGYKKFEGSLKFIFSLNN